MRIKKCYFCLIFFVIFIIFCVLYYRFFFSGHNRSNKSVNNVINEILQMKSYQANVEVTVTSNKTTNKYLLKQRYKKDEFEEQEVLKPENIQGLIVKFEQGKLVINNSSLNLSKIYSEYPYLSDNVLCLSSFVKLCNENKNNLKIVEKEEEIILEVNEEENKYFYNRKLYINKKTGNPTKMEIKDNSNKYSVYIIYNEMVIN